jgi:hypothetical protein
MDKFEGWVEFWKKHEMRFGEQQNQIIDAYLSGWHIGWGAVDGNLV